MVRVRLLAALVAAGCLLTTGCTINLPGPAPSSAPTSGTPTLSNTAPTQSAAQSGSQEPTDSGSVRPSEASMTLDWAQVFSQDSSSVRRISTASCDDQTYAVSGFVVGPNLIMTPAHVVDGTRVITLQTPRGDLVRAHVLGEDLNADTALLRADASLPVKALPVSSAPLAGGADLAVLGYPLGVSDVRIVNGIVSSTDYSVDYQDQHVDHVFTTNASTNGGNSGGPVVDHAGAVIGLVSGGENSDSEERPVSGINYMVPAEILNAKLDAWQNKPVRHLSRSDDAEAPTSSTDLTVTVASNQADAGDIAQSLSLHGESINTGSYSTAWSLCTHRMQHVMSSESRWSSGLVSSYWTDLDIKTVSRTGDRAVVSAGLRTQQEAQYGHAGQTCSDWSMRYTMRLVSGFWMIDYVRPSAGSPTAC